MSFETNRSGALLWHTSTLFDAGAVCHGFSTRPGGVSPAPWDSLNLGVGRGDTAENVQENFRRFCAAVGTDPMRVVLSKQVHEPNGPPCDRGGRGQGPLARARLSECGRDDLQHAEPAARRLFRRLRHHPAARPGARSRRAPFTPGGAARRKGWFPSRFAGWARCSAPIPADVRAPSARHRPVLLRDGWGCAAGHARRASARAAEPYIEQRGAKWHVDLKGINAHWLRADGVEQIDVCAHCTACRPDLYWSHRRMGNARGAQIAMIALR